MHSSDREAFETQLGILFAGFPTFLTPQRVEAYWLGLQRMQLQMFTRCIEEALGESGEDKLPTPNMIWKISKRLRAAPAKPVEQPSAKVTCKYLAYANSVLLAYLCAAPAKDERTLTLMVAAKNRQADNYRDICVDEPDACKELLGKFVASLNGITGLALQPAALKPDRQAEAA